MTGDKQSASASNMAENFETGQGGIGSGIKSFLVKIYKYQEGDEMPGYKVTRGGGWMDYIPGVMAGDADSARKRAAEGNEALQKMLENASKSAKEMFDSQLAKLEDQHKSATEAVAAQCKNISEMFGTELQSLEDDPFGLLDDLDAGTVPAISSDLGLDTDAIAEAVAEEPVSQGATIVVSEKPVIDFGNEPITDLGHATISDLSEGLKKMAEEPASIGDTIILK